MKSIVNSQLTGKWYKHTRDSHSHELNCVEIFIYLSHKVNGQRSVNNNHLDLSGNRMKNISIYSRKYKLQLVMIEDYLKKIELEDPIKIILEEY